MLYLRRPLVCLNLTYKTLCLYDQVRTAAVYLKSVFCVYDIRQFPGHDTDINQIYGHQN